MEQVSRIFIGIGGVVMIIAAITMFFSMAMGVHDNCQGPFHAAVFPLLMVVLSGSVVGLFGCGLSLFSRTRR